MHGNVWEWCLDWDSDLSEGMTDPMGPPLGTKRVERGGGWTSKANRCVSSCRYFGFPSGEHDYDGFRIARTLSE